MMRCIPSVAFAMIAIAPLALHAQQIDPDTRIRVTAPCTVGTTCQRTAGEFADWTGSTLTLGDGVGGQLQLDVTPSMVVDVYRGEKRHALTGLGIGAGIGLAAAVAFKPRCDGFTAGITIGGTGCGDSYALVPIGAALGLAVGWLTRSEQWERIGGPAIAVQSMRGGVGVRAEL